MSDKFIKSSAQKDGNDLSSVVQHGGRWCICAWAWAAAVKRDPVNYEGLQLDCESTNGRLINVYETYASLKGPNGEAHPSNNALAAVRQKCNVNNNLQLEKA